MRSAGCWLLMLVGCASPSPAAAPAAAARVAAKPPAPKPAALAAVPFERFATLATSGARECRVELHSLGPAAFLAGFATEVAIGFGAQGGLAAWKAPDGQSLALRAVSPEGKPRAPAARAPVPESFKATHVVAIENGFVVIGLLYEWMHSRWMALVTNSAGQPLGAGTELELEHRYIHEVSPGPGRSVVVFATRALMVPEELQGLRGRFIHAEIAASGKIEQRVHELPLAHPLIRVLDRVHSLSLDGKPAWYVALGGEPRGELIHSGKVERLSVDELVGRGIDVAALTPADRVEFVMSLDESGIVFHRVAGGRPVGRPTPLPEGRAGIMDAVAWSGSRWMVAHGVQGKTTATAQLVALDCR